MSSERKLGAAIHSAIAGKHPEIFKAQKGKARVDDYTADSTPLIEPSPMYDEDAGADILLKNASLFDHGSARLRDIAIVKNVITRIDDPGKVEARTDGHTRIIDVEGRSVLPGFVDSHLHLSVGMQRLQGCDMEEVQTAEEFKHSLTRFAEESLGSQVIYVFGVHHVDPPIIPVENCRHFLDEIIEDKPLLVYAHDLHTAWANTRALDLAGLLHTMPPYPASIEALKMHDKILLGPDNIPSGELHEPEVYFLAGGALQALFPRSVEQQLADLKTVCDRMASLGITGVHRMALAEPEEDIAFLLLVLELEQRRELPLRISTSFSSVADDNMLEDVHRAYLANRALARARKNEIKVHELHDYLVSLLRQANGQRHESLQELAQSDETTRKHPLIDHVLKFSEDVRDTLNKIWCLPHLDRENPHRASNMPDYMDNLPKIRCDTVKIFVDGVIEENTAYRLDRAPTEGIPEFSQEQLDSVVELADKLGMQIAAHCIGNGAVSSMMNAVARAREKNKEIDQARGHTIPHRIEHIEMCSEEDDLRFGKEHVVASMQPHEQPPMTLWHELVPKKEWNRAFSWRGALDNGGILVFGSDWPIVRYDVRTGIRHATTREPWYEGAKEQRLTLQQAVDAYTSNAGRTEYSANIKGRIAPGMLADIVILDGDVRDIQDTSKRLPDIRMTICNGKITYDRSSDH